MLRLLILFMMMGSVLPMHAGGLEKKKEFNFQKNFNVAKRHLSNREISNALPYLLSLNENNPKNANLKYLIGLCYAELEIVNPRTIEFLTEASSKMSLEYNPNTVEELRVPINVYYYLSIAYAQNKDCDLAEKNRDVFMEIYPYNDSYYPDESMRWIKICGEMKIQPEQIPLLDFPNFKPFISPKKASSVVKTKDEVVQHPIPVSQEPRNTQEIKTQKLEYSTQYPLYGVKLGAFKEVVPVSRFSELKNVDPFMDKSGWIRYVVGYFSIFSQAEKLQRIIQGKGYTGAFMVNANQEKKFEEEEVSVNNINIKATSVGKVEYRIQIGAFNEHIPTESAELDFKIEGIEEHTEQDITYLTVGESIGKFKTYTEAKAYCQGNIDVGILDAFVIAINNGEKIPL